jgi:hypothetical protein
MRDITPILTGELVEALSKSDVSRAVEKPKYSDGVIAGEGDQEEEEDDSEESGDNVLFFGNSTLSFFEKFISPQTLAQYREEEVAQQAEQQVEEQNDEMLNQK